MALASWNIAVPGLYYDELIQIVPALAFAKGPFPSAVSWIPESEVWMFGRGLPLMTLDYIGAVKTIAYIPIGALFGVTPESVRYFTILLGALALFVTFLFSRVLFDSTVGAIAVMLLATDPSFVFFSRVDFGPTVIMMLTKAAGLWLLATWWKTGQYNKLLMGCFCLGLGVYDKANFIWIIGGIIFAAVIVAPHGIVRRLSAKSIGFASAGLLTGAAPLIWYNLSWPPRTIAALWAIDKPGAPIGGILEQFVYRIGVLTELLDGQYVMSWLGSQVIYLPLLSVFLCIVVLVVATQYIRSSRRESVRPVAFVLLCGLLILVMAAMTRGGYGHHHIILSYPFPHLAIAAVFVQSAKELRRLRDSGGSVIFTVILYISIAMPVIVHTITITTVLKELAITGGRGNWSDSIYKLNDYFITQEPLAPIIVLDWGIYYNLLGLSQGKLRCIDLWQTLNNPSVSPDFLKAMLTNQCYRYVLHSPNVTKFPLPRKRFFELAKSEGLHVKLVNVFSSRDGNSIFEVFSIEGQQLTSSRLKHASTFVSGHATISAIPNPVPIEVGDKAVVTTITWNTGDGSLGQLYVSVNGEKEILFAQGTEGAKDVSWIRVGKAYEFRLYSTVQHRRLLATAMVTRTFSCDGDERL